MMDSSDPSLDSVVLSGWPSCTDCISWSRDGELAVAVGEFVHILTPKQPQKRSQAQGDSATVGLRQWHSARIRTNTFTQSEWPNQHPAPSHNFSLGEEQSLSIVVGLAWSPPGIGPHRRSVLAVLTSNHVLSLWESNGTIGEWTRTVVINHTLGDYFGWVNEAGEDMYRQDRRIRAFAWSLPYRTLRANDDRVLSSKWGAQYLAVANNDKVVTILRVSKLRRKGRSVWNVQVTTHVEILAASSAGDAPYAGSLFQRAMISKDPILSLSWSAAEDSRCESFIHVAQRHRRSFIKVQANAESNGNGFADLSKHNLGLQAVFFPGESGPNGYHDVQNQYVPANAELNKKMEEARIEYDAKHCLDGNSVFRAWGFSSSDSQDAACITLHPSDMVEYSTPSLEKCTLLFAPTAGSMANACPAQLTTYNAVDVRLIVTGWILSAAKNFALILPVDRYLFGIAANYASYLGKGEMRQDAQSALARLYETSKSLLDGNDVQIGEQVPDNSLAASDVEKCLICEALIRFDRENLSKARCESGHHYTRCSLSLLTIQEPGISKYCSHCNRQFLDAEKLDKTVQETESSGPSLIASLFEEFDVCPYCRVKFRS